MMDLPDFQGNSHHTLKTRTWRGKTGLGSWDHPRFGFKTQQRSTREASLGLTMADQNERGLKTD